jgi:hypothetical protein
MTKQRLEDQSIDVDADGDDGGNDQADQCSKCKVIPSTYHCLECCSEFDSIRDDSKDWRKVQKHKTSCNGALLCPNKEDLSPS